MKLYYRAASYEYNPNKVENKEAQQPFQASPRIGTAYNLMYRGVSYHVDPNAQREDKTQQPVTYKLSFRGINYLVKRNLQGEVSLVSQLSCTANKNTTHQQDNFHGFVR